MAGVPRVLGVLAGEDMPLSTLKAWADSADLVIAADSGADRLLAIGARVDVIVGDLDSVTDLARRHAAEVVQINEQLTTDCDKLLELVRRRGHEALVLISVEGSQPDHELATLYSAARSRLDVSVAYRRGIGHILRGEVSKKVSVHPGVRISLMPITPCVDVDLRGVRWPLEGASISSENLVSISNVALGDEVYVEMRSGWALLYVERGSDPHWPQFDP